MRRAASLALISVVAIAAITTACSKSNPSKNSAAPTKEPASPGGAVTGGPAAKGVIGDQGAIGGAGAARGGPAAGADEEYQLETSVVPGAAGAETVARVVVRPGKGFHMNKDYPTKLSLELPAGVSSAKAVLEPADAEAFDDNQLAFAVKLTPAGSSSDSLVG